ncbi:D-alanine--D-alanine ligase [Mechercharimyces sp. CAU 1602]|uniref:D-alanine--D-alanine ligase n=1 Tax=Mechercharimyces sp. CAU 1602 TaxID=2973933 RepID=UPI002163E7E2|nr:D-alanine--D-alanine ligase [Mechercharimyces sp. CAU 1602]MCS1351469.1 D-alanine--D-alanine ligase [Mechercharimyces sp. CAU 1602]
MNKKIRVAVLFGGKSGEHEVSLHSAASVLQAIDRDRFEVVPIAITQTGEWHRGSEALPLLEKSLNRGALKEMKEVLERETAISASSISGDITGLKEQVDVVFPVLHGTFGEDGTMQGLLEIADIPYVGAGVLASAVGMDKVMMKKVFAHEGLPQGDFTYYMRFQIEKDLEQVMDEVEARFGYPCFIKPANLGSSVGISKADDRDRLHKGLKEAARFDRKVVVEEYINAREVEVAVLGNDEPEASVPGEIVSSNDFYDYRAKYIDGKSEMQIPAQLPAETLEEIRHLALQCYRAIDCTGLSRVDFFVRHDDRKIFVNEINTMPGFTPYSMYANLWKHSGLTYASVVTKLIELAMQRYEEKKKTITTFEVN